MPENFVLTDKMYKEIKEFYDLMSMMSDREYNPYFIGTKAGVVRILDILNLSISGINIDDSFPS